ncbi:MAG: hypothetical protein JXR10_14230 [Cyclobacteriaceae bacterium]
MNFYICLVGICALILTGCYDSGLDATLADNDIDYLDAGNRDNLVNDPYNIVGIIPDNKEWKVIVEYSGGCEKHSFVSWLDDSKTTDKSAQFYLYHNGNGDMCEAYLRDTVTIDISAMLAGIISDDDILSTEIITAINPSNNRAIEVDTELSRITQGADCAIASQLVQSSCRSGAWENLWFLLNDTHSNGKKIWLQPVANSANVALTTPELGEYKIGITLLFGLGNPSDQCEKLPEGMIVPVAINCLRKQ